MTTFKNTKFVKRDYETSNVVYCTGINAPNENWVETNDDMPASMTQLYIIGETRYFGWL
jgi:hypothetical protein